MSFSKFQLDIAIKKIPGVRGHIMRGHNPDIDTAAFEDVWEAGGEKQWLTAAETMHLTSTSANDATGGTGVTAVRVLGVDNDYNEIVETVPMTGLTNSTTSQAFLRINQILALTSGSLRTNDGSIIATASTAGTVQAQMNAGECISQDCHFTVPTGWVAIIPRGEINAAKIQGGGGAPVVEVKFLVAYTASSPWIQLFDKKIDTAAQDELDVDIPLLVSFPERCDLRCSAGTDVNNTEVRVRGYFFLIDKLTYAAAKSTHEWGINLDEVWNP
jgi:hypothetical protein